MLRVVDCVTHLSFFFLSPEPLDGYPPIRRGKANSYQQHRDGSEDLGHLGHRQDHPPRTEREAQDVRVRQHHRRRDQQSSPPARSGPVRPTQVGAHGQGEDDRWTVHVFDQRAAQQQFLPDGGWTGQVRVHFDRRLAHPFFPTDGRPTWYYEDGQSCGQQGDVRDAGVITTTIKAAVVLARADFVDVRGTLKRAIGNHSNRPVRRHFLVLRTTEILSAPSSSGRSGYMIFTHVATASMTCSTVNG